MQSAPVDLHSEEFLQPDVAQMDLAAEVFQHGELTGLIGRFKNHYCEPKRVGQTIRESWVELALVVEEPHTSSALSGLHHQLNRSGVHPTVSLCDQLIDYPLMERASMLLPQLKLDLEPSFVRHSYDVSRVGV